MNRGNWWASSVSKLRLSYNQWWYLLLWICQSDRRITRTGNIKIGVTSMFSLTPRARNSQPKKLLLNIFILLFSYFILNLETARFSETSANQLKTQCSHPMETSRPESGCQRNSVQISFCFLLPHVCYFHIRLSNVLTGDWACAVLRRLRQGDQWSDSIPNGCM